MDGSSVINPDLQRERDNATFDVDTLTYLLDGSDTMTHEKRQLFAKALKEPVFTEGPPTCFLSREELYDRSVKKYVTFNKLAEEWQLPMLERQWLAMIAFPMESAPDTLHGGMFLPTIQNQASEEQKERWLPKMTTREYTGTYAQTEMGHGTHLRKLETTATYDPQREEFVLHSPTTSSMKWWPGGLGKTSNSAVVMAQLYSQGVNHGIFPFFVIFRDLRTHEPLPGVTVGDIGPKFGFNTIDNGFLKFDSFRIPRENFLMKNAEVLKDGTLVMKTTQKKASYGTMTMVRTFIVRNFGFISLAAGMTIAIRYSAVRRQSELKPGAEEPQVLDFQTQQYKLFPYLAMTYAFKFAFDRLLNLYVESVGESRSGNDSLMPELHALSSGLKSYCTSMAMLGLEQGRLSCGGHGYSQASGFPKIYAESTPAATFEGENTVLLLQLARYLIRSATQAERGENLDKSVQYLAEKRNERCSIDERFTLESLKDAFQHRASWIVRDAVRAYQQEISTGTQEDIARNNCGVFLTRAGIVHCQGYVMSTFAEAIESLDDVPIAKVMTQLCQLLGAFLISNESGDFIEDGYMTREQLKLVRDKQRSLLADIRPNAVALVDAFDFPDIFLGSVLGRYDGQVYENLYKWALESPLNKTEVHDSYYKYIQPAMKSKI